MSLRGRTLMSWGGGQRKKTKMNLFFPRHRLSKFFPGQGPRISFFNFLPPPQIIKGRPLRIFVVVILKEHTNYKFVIWSLLRLCCVKDWQGHVCQSFFSIWYDKNKDLKRHVFAACISFCHNNKHWKERDVHINSCKWFTFHVQ